MNFIDICSGIGGFRSALEMNGHNCLAFAEIDKYAKQSYRAIYDTEGEDELDDITAITDEHFRLYRGQCDIITGGFPCQAFSIAGNRRGFDDTRGTIFFHIARAIKEIQPSYVLLENVKGLFSHDKGRTFGSIIQALDELGYVTEWGLFNSKYWGVPQNRERVYILVTRKDKFKGPVLFDLLKQQTEVTTRLIDVLEDEVDEKYYLSEEKTKKLTLNINVQMDNEKSTVPVLTPNRLNKRQNGRRFKEDGEPMFTLTSQDRHGIAVREATKQGYALAEQGDSVNVSYPTSKTRRGRVGKQVAQTLQAGEVNQGVIINPLKDKTYRSWRYEQNVFNSDGITRSLKASLGGTPEIINEENRGLKIRKLTPLECWRLQGFTDEQFYKAKDSGVSNSQLYKQAGNSVSVPVVDAIVKCL
ncbi:DNA methylase [Staphylococcus saprophyticus]|uniref:DNA (cytosine-5-)-methyltransferase n=1 Tax=Staphylococcus saprophyticus TaxID=29385 RepID=UPI000853AC75|nr:DNA (cytosine-5-)-methyltransferase [Staphylococcus saprophyticus]MDW4018938.1 DNA (cytosine-5-)-methyltransferase [Staphylococcus saprophyticus]MDW4271897.1 DNA (cytosine-5-)-methyltransferase [Staphylococcus saprophyticus]OEK29696.1 DNA methylase [Staphylococcus saprophyticus]